MVSDDVSVWTLESNSQKFNEQHYQKVNNLNNSVERYLYIIYSFFILLQQLVNVSGSFYQDMNKMAIILQNQENGRIHRVLYLISFY